MGILYSYDGVVVVNTQLGLMLFVSLLLFWCLFPVKIICRQQIALQAQSIFLYFMVCIVDLTKLMVPFAFVLFLWFQTSLPPDWNGGSTMVTLTKQI